jgi:hypothetical protein
MMSNKIKIITEQPPVKEGDVVEIPKMFDRYKKPITGTVMFITPCGKYARVRRVLSNGSSVYRPYLVNRLKKAL